MTQTKEIYFLAVLEAGKSKIKVQESWFLVRTLFLACKQQPSQCPHMGEVGGEARDLVSLLLIRALTPSDQGPILMTSFNPDYFPQGLVSKCSYMREGGTQQMNLVGGHNSAHNGDDDREVTLQMEGFDHLVSE